MNRAPHHGLIRKLVVDWLVIRARLNLHRDRLYRKWLILCTAFCSFRGHIQNQSAKDVLTLPLGWIQKSQHRQNQEQSRRIAQMEYIRMVQAEFPWVDVTDLGLFLMGFDAGQRHALYTQGIEIEIDPKQNSWLTLAEKKHGSVLRKLESLSNDSCRT